MWRDEGNVLLQSRHLAGEGGEERGQFASRAEWREERGFPLLGAGGDHINGRHRNDGR
jgi:hypothetical protein